MTGKVYLVGAGPGDPDLLTVKALRVLRGADVVLYDELVAPEILRVIPQTARLENVGKRAGQKHITQLEINRRLVALARQGSTVARLKAGDPMVFARGGEEIEALREAGIDVEIVPGVTAGLGAAASIGIPLTLRGAASALVFVTGHLASGIEDFHIPPVSEQTTLVIYMPGAEYWRIRWKLRSSGVSGETPCAIISRATTPHEEVFFTSVEELPSAPHLPTPTLLVVGSVVGLATRNAAERSTERDVGNGLMDPLRDRLEERISA
jgi:uroporphyrin-III C-methyltransferase